MKSKPQAFLLILGIIAWIVISILESVKAIIFSLLDIIVYYKKPIFIVIIVCIGIFVVYKIYIFYYFKSKKFKNIKDSVKKHITNCNNLNDYIQELQYSYVNIKSYDFGQSQMIDSSNYNFKRTEWTKEVKDDRTHNCSATICKNASIQPIKYFCKYFDIEKNERSLSNFEKILNDFTSVEEGKILLLKERKLILESTSKSIPFLIFHISKNKLIDKLGFDVVNFSDLYIPIFTFQYVSAGGNSSSKCDIKLDIENLNKLVNYLNDVIKWRKSVAGQRALMTSNLRESIKKRDNYTCRNCNLSIENEQNLLLEVDHITPVSKGGLTTEKNLQTLCWRCNRKKGVNIEKTN